MRQGTARSLGFVFTLVDKRRSGTKINKKFGYQHQLQERPKGFQGSGTGHLR